jgi:Tat protein translocase TatC
MTLGEHLDELRSRAVRLLIGLAVGFFVCFAWRERLMQVLLGPTFAVLNKRGLGSELVALDPMEPFMTTLKTAAIMGLILSAPYGLYQVWAFVAAGLYKHERVWVQRFIPVSITLFMTGAIFFLVVVMPILLTFLVGFMDTVPQFDPGSSLFGDRFVPSVAQLKVTTTHPTTAPTIPVLDAEPADAPPGYVWLDAKTREIRVRTDNESLAIPTKPAGRTNTIKPTFSMRNTIDFTLEMAASFGIGFQVPVIVAFLAAVGIVSAEKMSKSRRITWFVMSIAAAIATPSADPTTMLLLLIPMAFLFEAGLVAARRIEKRKAQREAAEAVGGD